MRKREHVIASLHKVVVGQLVSICEACNRCNFNGNTVATKLPEFLVMALSQKVLSGPSETSVTTSGNCKLMYKVIAEIISGNRGVGDAHISYEVRDNITCMSEGALL